MKKTDRFISLLFLMFVSVVVFSGCDAMSSMGSDKQVLPAAPSAPTISSSTSSTLTVWWPSVSGATTYYAYYSTSSSFSSSQYVSTSGTSVTITGLSSSTTYYVWIAAENYYGPGPISDVASKATSASISVPSAPTGVYASTYSTTSVKVTWSSVSNASMYYVYYGTTSLPTTLYTFTTGTSSIVTGLTYGTKYYFRVRAYNSNGYSAYSSTDYSMPGYY